MRQLVGLGYRRAWADWIRSRPPEVGCLEITAEHFYDGDLDLLRSLSADYPIFVHGLGLSLGSPGRLDAGALERFSRVAQACQARWVSEHVAFTRAGPVDLGHLNPVRPTRESLRLLSDHAREVSDRCGRPLLLENIASLLRLPGEMPETEFLNRLSDLAGCGLLLDVTNLLVNSRNHRFDPLAWVGELVPERVVQLHVVGYSERAGRWHDLHAEPIQRDLLGLTRDVLARAPVEAVIVERDRDFPPAEVEARELRTLEELCGSV